MNTTMSELDRRLLMDRSVSGNGTLRVAVDRLSRMAPERIAVPFGPTEATVTDAIATPSSRPIFPTAVRGSTCKPRIADTGGFFSAPAAINSRAPPGGFSSAC